ncbi:TonB-dependent receptor plug domain-containing protein [Mucilaginibacter sp.]|uniref:TonB-dependent receptor plug domain-containing protein n=1 Tax=Mucilaginibacter sp. TaxID=1882438 RepID=UPI002842E168|nr:TonB-dependent receptor plug domain-containing protein [Mucilaginibacter sp.]MDR3693060.1 TonB-dependent receptor plug domain-containing protein [Mucilaginibacter sp.]
MKKLLLMAIIFGLGFRTIAFAQPGNDAVNTAVSNLKSLLTDHIIEKAYLHFDRPYPYYVAGEVVYFKAYVTLGEKHEASTLSNILHVDLIDKNDALMQSIVLQLTGGTAWGDFVLPDTLQKGSYRIRVYTQWMRNDKTPYFFDQYISVSSANTTGQLVDNTTQGLKPNLQFFPEGGNLVADVPARLAYKALGTNGLGMGVKGIVIDNEHKEVAKISSAHLGMGMFYYIPETGKTYKAMVTFADGSQSSVDLPAAQPKGITLSVNTDDPAKVAIIIRANRAYYKENQNKKLNLLVYYGGALKRYSPVLDGEILGLDLAAKDFPTGILKVTLLSETGEPLNERISFIQNPDLLNLALTANKQVFNTRENVQVNLNVKNKDGNPVSGSFSVSVVDESKILVDDDAENTILSYLLLSTEVKGYIEKPNFYFTNVTKESRADLDILMLTQGYRRFEWAALENGSLPVTANAYTTEKTMDISGVLKTKSGAPIVDCMLTLIPKAGGNLQTATTDNEGKFHFSNMDFSAGTTFILKALSSSGKKGVLTLDKLQPPPAIVHGESIDKKYNASADILLSFQDGGKARIAEAGNGVTNQVANVSPDNSGKRRENYRSSNIGGPGHADQVVLGDDIRNSSSLSEALRGLLHGVQFSEGMPYLQTGVTLSGNGAQIDPMLVIVDGVDLGNGVNVNTVNPSSVEAVEVLKGANASIYGSSGGQGVLVITTRITNGNEQIISKEMSPGIFSIEPKGFFKALEFYSPAYNTQNASGRPDQRTTIFWKPDVITDSFGNSTFSFFNSDGKGTYRVEVQGMDNKGNLGMQVLRYKVQ